MALVEQIKKGGRYTKKEQEERRIEVYQMRMASQWAYQEILGQGIVGSLDTNKESGGCLIASATYGSELATQVQLLREIRDNAILSTSSGTSFMSTFNAFYYSFSPAVADLERQNPMFKEMVKVAITPLLSTLSLLQYVDIDSEADMLGYGIGIILLNVGMYFVTPALVFMKIKYHFIRK